jgi:hypothetical protein
MATTIPTEFTGHATCDTDKVAIIREWYETNLRDSDKAAEGYDLGWYSGQADAFETALRLLFNMPLENGA